MFYLVFAVIKFVGVNNCDDNAKMLYVHFNLLGNNYQLKMRFVDHIYDDFVVDHFTLRIILPEGSK